MIETSRIKYPLNKWDKESIRPGPVGSVGDVLTSVRIKQSMPDMPFAYDKTFSPSSDVLRGSNVQDGRWESFVDGGYGPVIKKQKWSNSATGFKTSTGWIAQNIIPEQRVTEPKVAPQGQAGYETQAAAILHKSGDMFGELPGGYKAPAGVLPRGGMLPRLVTKNSRPLEEEKIFNWTIPVEKVDKVLPKYNTVLDRIVENFLPTPANNLNSRRASIVEPWLAGLGKEVVGSDSTSNMKE